MARLIGVVVGTLLLTTTCFLPGQTGSPEPELPPDELPPPPPPPPPPASCPDSGNVMPVFHLRLQEVAGDSVRAEVLEVWPRRTPEYAPVAGDVLTGSLNVGAPCGPSETSAYVAGDELLVAALAVPSPLAECPQYQACTGSCDGNDASSSGCKAECWQQTQMSCTESERRAVPVQLVWAVRWTGLLEFGGDHPLSQSSIYEIPTCWDVCFLSDIRRRPAVEPPSPPPQPPRPASTDPTSCSLESRAPSSSRGPWLLVAAAALCGTVRRRRRI